MRKKLLTIAVSVVLTSMSLIGCGPQNTAIKDDTTIRVGAMSGPTAMGLVKLMEDSKNGNTVNNYEFMDLATDASALVAPMASGELDIAAVPSNLAATLYNNTEHNVIVVAINNLGVLNLVARGDSVNSISDLSGKKIYATGQGAVPEYTIRYVLDGNGINPENDVEIQWCADTTEALSYITEAKDAIAILPQPFATAACAQVEDLKIVEDLNDSWAKLNPGCEIVTGVIVANASFAKEHKGALDEFLKEYKASVEYTSTNPEESANLIVDFGIVKAAPLAQKALPGCHLQYLDGEDMKKALNGFLEIVYNMNPKAVGGTMPDDGFYY